MWLFTPDGFYSIVRDKRTVDPDALVIRGRARGDLDRLAERYGLGTIEESGYTDYRYRIAVTRDQVAEVVADAVRRLDYTNFKDRVTEVVPARHDAYMDVWSVMYRVQASEPR